MACREGQRPPLSLILKTFKDQGFESISAQVPRISSSMYCSWFISSAAATLSQTLWLWCRGSHCLCFGLVQLLLRLYLADFVVMTRVCARARVREKRFVAF